MVLVRFEGNVQNMKYLSY